MYQPVHDVLLPVFSVSSVSHQHRSPSLSLILIYSLFIFFVFFSFIFSLLLLYIYLLLCFFAQRMAKHEAPQQHQIPYMHPITAAGLLVLGFLWLSRSSFVYVLSLSLESLYAIVIFCLSQEQLPGAFSSRCSHYYPQWTKVKIIHKRKLK